MARRLLSWLLRSNRSLGEDKRLRSARQFAAEFRNGPAMSSSQVTRWETGQISVDAWVVSRYESMLGLPHLSLTVTYEAVRRFTNGRFSQGKVEDPGDTALHSLVDRARTPGAMSGEDWRAFTTLLESRPDLVLHPPRLWSAIAENLLNELVVAQHQSWFIRQEAMSKLLGHHASAIWAAAACTAMADDASVPVCIEPISLLDASTLPTVSQYVMMQLSDPRSSQALRGALLAATAKVKRGHFSPAERQQVAATTNELLQHSAPTSDTGLLALDLAAALHSAPVRATPRQPSALSTDIALGAQNRTTTEAHDPDPVLPHLIDTALFAANPDSRLYSSAVVAATPYRTAVADELMSRIDRLRDRNLEASLRFLTQLRVPTHRSLIARLLTDATLSASTHHAAAWATAHSEGHLDETTWRRVLSTQTTVHGTHRSHLYEEILCGLAYGVGTDGHVTLLAELAHHPALPARARLLASWWKSHHLRPSAGPHQERLKS